MQEKTFKEKMTDHPIIWVLGTLLTGFLAGIGVVLALENYQGMEMIARGNHEKLKDENISLKNKLTNITDQRGYLEKSDTSLIKLERSKKENQKTLKMLDLCKDKIDTLQLNLSQSGECITNQDSKISNLEASNAKINTTNHLDSMNENNLDSTKSKTGIILEKEKKLIRHTVNNLFDNTLVLVFEYLSFEGKFFDKKLACIRINEESQCHNYRVGEIIPLPKQNLKYKVRVVSVNTDSISISILEYKN